MDHRSAVLVLTFLAAAALALTASPKHSYSHVKRDDVTAQTSWTGFDNCTEDQKTTLKQAAKDMRNIAFEGLIKFDRDIGPCDKYPCKNTYMIPFWDIAAIQFFGPEKENSDYQHIIMNQYYTLTESYPGWGWADWWYNNYVDLSCKESALPNQALCYDDKKNPVNYAYLAPNWFEPPKGHESEKFPRIVFCPIYFTSLPSHAEAVRAVGNDKDRQRNLLNFRSQATTFMHELMHIRWGTAKICDNPAYNGIQGCIDYGMRFPYDDPRGNITKAYRPGRVKLLAQYDWEKVAYNNDNYVWYAMYQWVRHKYSVFPDYPSPWLKYRTIAENLFRQMQEPGYPPGYQDLTVGEGEGTNGFLDPANDVPIAELDGLLATESWPDWYLPLLEAYNETNTSTLPVVVDPDKHDVSLYSPPFEDVVCQTSDIAPSTPDCAAAFQTMKYYDRADFPPQLPLAPYDDKNVGVYNSCLLVVEPLVEWTETCGTTFQHLDDHFNAIYMKCKNPNGTIQGWVPFSLGSCHAQLHMVNAGKRAGNLSIKVEIPVGGKWAGIGGP